MTDQKPPTDEIEQFPETALQHLLEREWEVFRKHVPVGAYLPVGQQLDGDCRECGGAWPCEPVLNVFIPVTKAIRDLRQPPASTSAEEA